MYKTFITLLFSSVVGCTTLQEVDTSNQVTHVQDTCGTIETKYKVVVSYADTAYAFAMDSSTLGDWDLIPDFPEVNLSPCHTKDVQVFHTITLNYDTSYYQIVNGDGLTPIDSTMMVYYAKLWNSTERH